MSESGESLLSVLSGPVSSNDPFAKLKVKVLASKRMSTRIMKLEGQSGEPDPLRYLPSIETTRAMLRSAGLTQSVVASFISDYPNCVVSLINDREVKFTENMVADEMRGFSSNVSLSEPKALVSFSVTTPNARNWSLTNLS